jgi:hypothetical protein
MVSQGKGWWREKMKSRYKNTSFKPSIDEVDGKTVLWEIRAKEKKKVNEDKKVLKDIEIWKYRKI